jgi:hypothetical protein
MKTLRQYIVAVLIMLTSLLMGCAQRPVERISAQICEHDMCYYQDVPAAQFIGKRYTKSILDCAAFGIKDGQLSPDSVMVGDRCYLMNPSEVTK